MEQFYSILVTFWTVCQPFRCATEASGLCWPGPSQRYILLQNSLRNHSWNSKISSKNYGSFFHSRALNYFSVRKKRIMLLSKMIKYYMFINIVLCNWILFYWFRKAKRPPHFLDNIQPNLPLWPTRRSLHTAPPRRSTALQEHTCWTNITL